MTNEEAINVLRGQESAYWHTLSEVEHKAFDLAVDALIAQQPRVLTLEAVQSQSWDYCYIEAEVRPHSKVLETLCGTHRLYCTTSIMLERQTRGDKEYGKTWRCWTARPTDKQMEATPWSELPKEGDKE